MPVTITTAITPTGAPVLDDPQTIEDLAAQQGVSVSSRSIPVAITVPTIRVEPQLHFDTRNHDSEFRFRTGTLALNLRQVIHLSTALNPCAQTIWLQHEHKHVSDNEGLMARIEPMLRADQEFIDLLVAPTDWHARGTLSEVQENIRQIVFDVFERLTSAAATHQDSAAEYRRIERQVRLRCGQRIGRRLHLGMYGDGIDMVQAALNGQPSQLPQLRVDGIFGHVTKRRVQEFQRNNNLEQDGIVGPDTRRALGIDP